MKKSLKFVATSLFSFGILFYLSSCGNNTKTAENTADSTAHAGHDMSAMTVSNDTHACPMHPEVTGKEGDKCPKCGMKLEPVKSDGKTYFMDFKRNPENVGAGKGGIFSFTPKIKGEESKAVPLDLVHDKKIHLIIVSNDLSYFEHIHPEYQASGNYDIAVLDKSKNFTDGRGKNETKFENGGKYLLYTDYNPSGSSHQLGKFDLEVAGTPKAAVNYTTEKLTSVLPDGYSLTLEAEGGKFLTNQFMHINGILKKDGKQVSVDDLENYLGAKAHMVVIGIEDKDYLHVHPESENGKFDLHTTFEKSGIYRGWVQFQAKGKVYTADFVIKVEQGTAKADTKPADHSSH